MNRSEGNSATKRTFLMMRVDRSTFPNMEGKNLDRALTVTDDVLRFTDVKASAGSFATVTFKRAH